MITAVEALERAVPNLLDDLPTKPPCPTCQVVLIDAWQIECTRCADMPRLVEEIAAFQPGNRDK